MDTTTDLAGMLADWDSATIGAATVTGVFDARYSAQLGMDGAAPAFTVASANAAGVAQGDPVVMQMVNGAVNTAAYTVADIQPDGTGLTRLLLQEA